MFIVCFENRADLFLISCSFIIETSFFVKDAEFSEFVTLLKSPNDKYKLSPNYLRPLFSKKPEVVYFLWRQ